MSREIYNLQKAAQHIHIEPNELKHVAQRGEIEAEKRGDEFWFDHRDLDEWAQRHILASSRKQIDAHHDALMSDMPKDARERWRIAKLFKPDTIDLELAAKTKGGLIRDMAELAIASSLVYDEEGFYKELVAREEAATTAIGCGAAFLHPRYHDPYFFEETFLAYGRAKRDIFFGAPDGETTRHFFLICSTDHERHLQILSRLALIAHGTNLLERLDSAESTEEAIEIISECEEEVCG